VSYAWGDKTLDASQEARQRQEVVERLCETLDKEGWHILRDSNVLRSGELLSCARYPDRMRSLPSNRLL